MSSSARWTIDRGPARPRGGAAAAGRRSTTRNDPTLFGLPVLLLVPVRADPGRGGAHRRSPTTWPRRTADRPTARRRPAMSDVSAVAFSVFIFLFLLVTVLGFAAARWRRAKALDNLDEWGLGGRGFGTFIAWFLIGGDLYTAYTFIAVPATAVRRQRDRLLRGAVHDRGLPADLPVPAAAVVGLPPARLRHAGRLRARAATTAGRSRWRSRSPASSRRCPTSRSSWSASRWCSR